MDRQSRNLIIIVILLSVIAAGCFGIGAMISASNARVAAPAVFTPAWATPTEKPSPTAKPTPTPTPEPTIAVYDEGMYKVGTDIPAGEYYAACTSGSAYIAILSDSSGDLDSIISNENFDYTYIFTVTKGQYLEIDDAEFALSSDIPPQTDIVTGMLRVGIDIKAGEYKLIPDPGESAYVAVFSNTKHRGVDNMITNDNFDSPRYITVKKGQYLYLVDCTIDR